MNMEVNSLVTIDVLMRNVVHLELTGHGAMMFGRKYAYNSETKYDRTRTGFMAYSNSRVLFFLSSS